LKTRTEPNAAPAGIKNTQQQTSRLPVSSGSLAPFLPCTQIPPPLALPGYGRLAFFQVSCIMDEYENVTRKDVYI
jgi:hypothetical protein